jgi:DNA-binding response OmpR family regulator
MDGPTAIKIIRSEGFRGLIIGLTGNTAQCDKETMMEAGADDVLFKPFDIDDFDELIRNKHIG